MGHEWDRREVRNRENDLPLVVLASKGLVDNTERFAKENVLVIILMMIDDLVSNPNNPRLHGELQIKRLMDVIRQFGFLVPILIDEVNLILAGHGRVEAARRFGYQEVPAICAGALTERQKKVFVLADNRIAELGKWDEALLAELLLDLTVELTEKLLSNAAPGQRTGAVAIAVPASAELVCYTPKVSHGDFGGVAAYLASTLRSLED